MGGLGHVAVQYAKAMGCGVVVFSGSEAKKEDSIALGATEFCLLPLKADTPKLKAGINVLLLCSDKLPDFEAYVPSPLYLSVSTNLLHRFLPLLARRAAIILLMIQGEPLVIP